MTTNAGLSPIPGPPIEDAIDRALAGSRAALGEVAAAIQDDVFRLAVRMLGDPAAAEDVTQEILVQVITHLAQWRREASFATWYRRIAVRSILRERRTRYEKIASFEAIANLCAMGDASPPLPDRPEAELQALERELRLVCTEGMLLALDRDHRIAWVLEHAFDLSSAEAAAVLEIDPATFRKRVQRARERLGAWMGAHCGLVSTSAACRCRRQIPVGIRAGVLDPAALSFSSVPVRRVGRETLEALSEEADTLERAAAVLGAHPDYAAPPRMLDAIKSLIQTQSLWPLRD